MNNALSFYNEPTKVSYEGVVVTDKKNIGSADAEEDEKLASDWDDMTKDGDESGEDETSSDNLFATEDEGPKVGAQGMEAIVNSTSVSYDRLPMLEVVFDRLVRMMSTSLRNFTSDNVEVTLEKISSVRFGDYLDSIPLPAMISVVKAEEWDNYALLTVDSGLIYSVVDVLLGGRRGTAAMPIEGRPFTTIERKLVERMSHVILSDLSAAFDPVSSVKFRFERLETNPRFATIARTANAATLAQLRIEMEDRGGLIELMIPNATLEPVRDLLLQMFLGEKFGRDAIWETHLARELWQTDVHLNAVLDRIHLPLSQVLKWEVGTEIFLNATSETPVKAACGDIDVFEGRMGRKNGNVSIKIEKVMLKR